ncbi:MAG: hypothetical protein WC716_15890 [Chitinophagaceae bacterium]|jgi:hypothetical protein
MKRNFLIVAIIAVMLAVLVFLCRDDNEIDTIAIVTPPNYSTNIIIFFEQDTAIGNVKKVNGEHLFYANSNPSIFFVKEKAGNSYLVNYCLKNGKLEKVDYVSEMAIKRAPDTSYQVIGGGYGCIHTDYYKKNSNQLPYSTFTAGKTADIKHRFVLSDSLVIANYKMGLGIK